MKGFLLQVLHEGFLPLGVAFDVVGMLPRQPFFQLAVCVGGFFVGTKVIPHSQMTLGVRLAGGFKNSSFIY